MGLEDQREKRDRRDLGDAVKGVSIAVVEAANIVAYAIEQHASRSNPRPGALSGEQAQREQRG